LLGNYLVTALRNIARHKLFSFINIAGLAVGLTCAILIILFAWDELSYDRWIPGSENLWRVEQTLHVPGRSEPIITAQIPMPLPLALRDQLPEVRSATRLAWQGITLTAGDRQFSVDMGVVEPNFLQVIPFPLLKGDPSTVLSRPDGIVLSETAAKRFFGDADPIGKILTTGRGGCSDADCAGQTVTLRVVGVMRDLPHNTHFGLAGLMPNTSLADRLTRRVKENWLSTNDTYGYVTLQAGADPAALVARMKPYLDRVIDISRYTSAKIPGSKILDIRLVPMREVHMTTDRHGAMKPPGSWTTLYGMMAIGVMILLVACINFMNLATARAMMRAREISLRKCVGARRGQLTVQFLGESVLMALAALVIAFALVEILLPAYAGFMGRPLNFRYIADWPLTLAVLGVAVAAGLLSGIYPALVLSGFRPATALRGSKSGRSGSGRVRAALVVLQFAVSIGLGISAMVVFQQIDFARNIDLGFNRDSIVTTGTGGKLTPDGMDSLQQALERSPGVLGVARSNFVPFNAESSVLLTQRPGNPQILAPNHIAVSPNYFTVYGIRILAGRPLSARRAEDLFFSSGQENAALRNEGHNVMVNATLARALGYAPDQIVGQTLIFGKSRMQVVGVAADTLAGGVRTPVVPTVYVHSPEQAQTFSIRVQPDRTQEAVADIARISRSFIPGVTLYQNFLSDNYERLYQADRKQGRIFGIFVGIAILIACLGLFGLAAFTAARRTREIGIRKIFGALNRDIILLLLWQFSIPVLLANVIAWPIAWYYLQDWLQGFAYRITLNPLYFVGVGLAALLIAWLTVFTHAWRVARANPIHALRTE
jgi:putative ABC transport system permease protein